MPSLDDALTSMVSMRGRSVGLRPLYRPDFPLLYVALTAGRAAELDAGFPGSPLRRVRPGDRRLAARRRHHDIVDLESGAAAGFARAYHLNTVDGYAYVMGYAAEAYRLRRHTAEATALFGRYLFEQFPLRKSAPKSSSSTSRRSA